MAARLEKASTSGMAIKSVNPDYDKHQSVLGLMFASLAQQCW